MLSSGVRAKSPLNFMYEKEVARSIMILGAIKEVLQKTILSCLRLYVTKSLMQINIIIARVYLRLLLSESPSLKFLNDYIYNVYVYIIIEKTEMII